MPNTLLRDERISTLLIKFCIPAIIAMAISGVQMMVDGLFVGNLLGANAMASINMASPFIQVIIGVVFIASIGTQSYLGIKVGEGNIKLGQDIFKTATMVVVSIGIIVMFIGFVASDEIARLLGANDVLVHDTATYIRTFSLFTVPLAVTFLFGFVNRILGKPELYFKGMVLSLFVNITLNYILIAKFQLGIQGAAIATGLSYSSALLVVIWPVLNRKSSINLFVGRFNAKTITPVLYNGSSEGMNAISAAVYAYVFNMAFMQIAGEAGVAAFTVINYVAQFGILLMFGVSDGIGPIVSYNYGAKQFHRLHEVMRRSYQIIIGIAIAIFFILFFFGKPLVSMFVQGDTAIIELASTGAKIFAFAFLLSGFNILYSGYFTFIGYAKESVIVAAARGLVFIVIGIIVLPILFGMNGVWMTVPFAEICTFVIGMTLMKRAAKETQQVKAA